MPILSALKLRFLDLWEPLGRRPSLPGPPPRALQGLSPLTPLRAYESAFDLIWAYSMPTKLKVNSILLLTSSRYSSCVLAPQLLSPPTPICIFAQRITV